MTKRQVLTILANGLLREKLQNGWSKSAERSITMSGDTRTMYRLSTLDLQRPLVPPYRMSINDSILGCRNDRMNASSLKSSSCQSSSRLGAFTNLAAYCRPLLVCVT